MTDYEYDKNLPYVLVAGGEDEGRVIARFAKKSDADYSIFRSFLGHVIDTTPKPRVPEDAKFITYRDGDGDRWYAEREGDLWRADDSVVYRTYDLPGVTPDTVFTVLDARDERGSDDV